MAPFQPGSMITDPYQYEISNVDGGLLLGHGTAYMIEEITGLAALPGDNKISEIIPPVGHGGFAGVDYMGVRKIAAKVAVLPELIYSTDPRTDMEYLLEQLANAMQVSKIPLTFAYLRPGFIAPRKCVVMPRKRDFPYNADVTYGLARGGIELHAYDPKFYSTLSNTVTVPLAIGATSGSVAVTSFGGVETGPVITLTGVWQNPNITVSGGSANAPYNFTIVLAVTTLATDVVVVDTINRAVTINGVDRYDIVSSSNQWWAIQPGDNVIAVNRANSAATGTMSLTWADAWA